MAGLDELVGRPQTLPNMRSARLVQVIQTVTLEGGGTADEPYRQVTRYWSEDGTLLAERDGLETESDATHPR